MSSISVQRLARFFGTPTRYGLLPSTFIYLSIYISNYLSILGEGGECTMLKQHQLDTVCSPQPDKDDDTGSVGSASGGSAAAGGSTSPPDSPAVIPITQVI